MPHARFADQYLTLPGSRVVRTSHVRQCCTAQQGQLRMALQLGLQPVAQRLQPAELVRVLVRNRGSGRWENNRIPRARRRWWRASRRFRSSCRFGRLYWISPAGCRDRIATPL